MFHLTQFRSKTVFMQQLIANSEAQPFAFGSLQKPRVLSSFSSAGLPRLLRQSHASENNSTIEQSTTTAMATTKQKKAQAKKRQLRIACLLLPLAMMLPKAIDAYLHCDQTVDFFTADLAASIALILAGILLLIIDGIYSKHGPPGGTPSKRRIAYAIFQIIMAVAIFGTGIYCFVGNVGSSVSNAGAAAATTDDVVEQATTDSWRMDPFDVCSANNDQGRILEVFRQQPEVHRSTHRATTLVETILAIGWIAMAFGLPFIYFNIWKLTCAGLEVTQEVDPEQNEDLDVNCWQTDDGRCFCDCGICGCDC